MQLKRWKKMLFMATATAIVGSASAGVVSAQAAEKGHYSLFGRATGASAYADHSRVEVGTQFSTTSSGQISSVRFLKAPHSGTTHDVSVWTSTGELLSRATSKQESASGWQTVKLAKPVSVTAGQRYVVSYNTSHYMATQNYFVKDAAKRGPLSMAVNSGVYKYSATSVLPTLTYKASNYWVDVVFTPRTSTSDVPQQTTSSTAPPSTQKPTTTSTSTTLPSAPSSTVKPTTTTTQAPGTSTTVPSQPASGFPSLTNTGVPAGTTLGAPSGDLTVSTNGAVIDAQHVRGVLTINADNVTVKRSKIECVGNWWNIRVMPSAENVRIEDNTLVVAPGKYCQYGIAPDGSKQTILRNQIVGLPNGIEGGGSFTAEDNYIKLQKLKPEDHVDGVQIGGGGSGPYVIRHNTILNPGNETGCISLFNDFGAMTNVLVENNYLDGAGYTVYGGAPNSSNVRFINNTFGKTFWPKGGHWGPVAYWDGSDPGNEWSGNRWTDGSPVVP
jgi:hypothetical protein